MPDVPLQERCLPHKLTLKQLRAAFAKIRERRNVLKGRMQSNRSKFEHKWGIVLYMYSGGSRPKILVKGA